MTRRTGRGHINTAEILPGLAAGRAAAVKGCQQAKIGSPEYRDAENVIEAIDDLVGRLTGDREYLLPGLSTTPPRE